MTNNGDRSAKGENAAADNISGNINVISANKSVIVSGSNNQVDFDNRVRVESAMPPPTDIDLGRELAALRELLAALEMPDAGKMERALLDAEEEAAKAERNKNEIREALERGSQYAKAADNFSEHAEKIARRIADMAAWAGFSF